MCRLWNWQLVTGNFHRYVLLHPIQLVVQRLQADAEHLRGAGLVVARGLERGQNQFAFGFVDRHPGAMVTPLVGSIGRGGGPKRGRCCASMNSPRARIVARSMTLRSSRTLPGQS